VAPLTQGLEAVTSSLIINRQINSIPTMTHSSYILIVGVAANGRAVK
jgi:hypothetical protein